MAEEDSKKRLGRGLAALIGEIDTQTSSWQDDGSMRADRKIPIEYVQGERQESKKAF